MVSETYKVGKLIADFERANPDAKDVPRELKQKFHEAWALDKVNNRPRVDYIWKGNPYYSDPKGGGKFGATNRVLKYARNSKRRGGVKFTLDDYINHPRFAGDPALATAMYQYWEEQHKRQFRFNSKTNHLDHIVPVKGKTPGLEHARSKMLLGDSDNVLKGNKMPSDEALAYMQIGKTKPEMIDLAASSPWPRQTPRDKRLILQNDLGIEFKKGMGLPKLQDALASATKRAGKNIAAAADIVAVADIVNGDDNVLTKATKLSAQLLPGPAGLAAEAFNSVNEMVANANGGDDIFDAIPTGSQEERREKNLRITNGIKVSVGQGGLPSLVTNEIAYMADSISKGTLPYSGSESPSSGQ